MNWEVQIPKLREVFTDHFPDVPLVQTEQIAKEIYHAASTADSYQWIERSNTVPSTDTENIQKAAKLIADAAGKIEKLGWHGGVAVQVFTRKLWCQANQVSSMPALSNEHAIQVLAKILQQMSDELIACADTIDPNAPSVLSAFDVDEPVRRHRGRPAETRARFVAGEIYKVFEIIIGKKPTVTTDPYKSGHPASGPFLELLKDVFNALEINASAETWARVVCKENNPAQE